jgi:ATP-dependent Lhr-like helicase
MHEALMQLGVATDGEAEASGWNELLERLSRDRRVTQVVIPGGSEGPVSWVTAERLPQLLALHPRAACEPCLEIPADYARSWPREDALRELVRGRLGAMAVTTAAAIADALAVDRGDIDFALLALEQEGCAMRGRFTPGAAGDEWCERHLLARIHRNTLGRLRREIEPVDVRDFVRFLCDWQRVSPAARLQGPEALAGVLAQLEGFEAAAVAWESELLPARIKDYSIAWLDDLCTAGRVAWTRLRAGGESLVRAAPILLLPRRELPLWTRMAASQQTGDGQSPLSSRAQKVADCLREQGALFFDELAGAAHLLETELEDALAELVARGRVGCDSFSGLRALLLPAAKKPANFGRRGRRAALMGIADAGRWSLVRRPATDAGVDPGGIEHVARVLLRRYGVVCWRLLEREAQWLPPWRELLREYQRLEARGEIRGGRFIAGVVGQQFALPEAVASLRAIRKRAHDGAMIAVSAADPLNLLGGILAGDKVPRQPGARLLLRDGIPVATLVAGEFKPLVELSPADRHAARMTLLRDPGATSGSAQTPGSRPMADPLGLHS